MARKLDKFKGKIDFKNDSKDKIQKTLKELSEYLNSYQEDEAAKIVESFQQSGTSPKGHKERIQEEQFLKAYKARTTILGRIDKTLKRIQEDLIDEQANAGKAGKAAWTSKPKPTTTKTKDKATEQLDRLKRGPLDWLKEHLFGTLIGGLLKKLLSPLKWILGGLFAAGKVGFKAVSKIVGSIFGKALAAGGAIASHIRGQLGDFYQRSIAPKIQDLRRSLDDKVWALKSTLQDKKDKAVRAVRHVGAKARTAADKAFLRIGAFFGGTAEKVKNKASGLWQAAKSAAPKAMDKASDLWRSASSTISEATKKKWSALKSRVLSIGEKILGFFKKSNGKAASKASTALASRLPKAMGKFASKFLPGIGMALLAYDVYAAAKKSNSVVSFSVNLIDGISGGLISLGLGAALTDFDGENLGSYVDNLLKGSSLGLDGSEMDLLDGIDMAKMEAASQDVLKILNTVDTLSMQGEESDVRSLEQSLEGNPQKQKILEEYRRLTTSVNAGEITRSEASQKLREFIQRSVGTIGPAGMAGAIDPDTGLPMVGGEAQAMKSPDVNLAAVDSGSAMQAHTSMLTMAYSADLAMQASKQMSENYSQMILNVQTPAPARSAPPPQPTIQG